MGAPGPGPYASELFATTLSMHDPLSDAQVNSSSLPARLALTLYLIPSPLPGPLPTKKWIGARGGSITPWPNSNYQCWHTETGFVPWLPPSLIALPPHFHPVQPHRAPTPPSNPILAPPCSSTLIPPSPLTHLL